MTHTEILTGTLYHRLIQAGTSNLRAHVQTVNDLNVFPIPDGDTGDNMLLTMHSGASCETTNDDLSTASRNVAQGMLLGARGNSGVILSQFFDGIACGLKDTKQANAKTLGEAFKCGVAHAYDSVMSPTEGTILTVIKDATNYACNTNPNNIEDYIDTFIEEAKRSLKRTPELLSVLKKAGVVDSGGAGLIYIMEGMQKIIKGEKIISDEPEKQASDEHIDFSLFDENSEMKFGYCTELLLRLQNKKVDVEKFDCSEVSNYLETIGDSIVAFKNESIVKIHVHTYTPEKVLEFCRKYGEFLTVKIENMSLQHSNTVAKSSVEEISPKKERTKYAIVAVASGEGIKNTFIELGADVIVDGGQSMNPSAADFINAFDEANADEIFVFPNNGNIILAANQAANIYEKSKVYVIESKTIGDGYAAISMMNPEITDTQELIDEFIFAMDGVVTAEVSKSVRDSQMQEGVNVECGDYIGFIGKEILASEASRLDAAKLTAQKSGLFDHDICIIIRGVDSTAEEAQELSQYIKTENPLSEVYIIDGGQSIYSYILIAE